MIRRREDWPEVLAHYEEVSGSHELPFAWGVRDCCTLACDAFQLITGVDVMADLRGYHTALEATRRLKRFAGGGLEQAVEKIAAQFGLQEIVPGLAQRGDAVLVDVETPDGVSVALAYVCTNGMDIATMAPVGVKFLPLASGRRAWRIG